MPDQSLTVGQGSSQGLSGLNAHWSLAALAAEFARLRAAAGQAEAGDLAETDDPAENRRPGKPRPPS